jgi:hypothetical protein
MEKHNLDKLASGIKTLQQTIAKLGHDDPTPELLRIIHKPGWTTIAEFALVTAGLQAAQDHAEALTRQLNGLLAGARQVG